MPNQKKKLTKYTFLHEHIAKEAYIFDILDEISEYQKRAIKLGKSDLADLDNLKKSSNIKMPFTPTRNKNISYLVELLLKNYPEEIRGIVSFNFIIDPVTKKLDINEKQEFTVSLNNEDFNKLQNERDNESIKNLLELLSNFRLFNLTKLAKKIKHKSHLAKLIKSQLGSDIFTFKNFTVNRNNLELSEDYSFHKINYESVKNSLDLENLKKIISGHSNQILRRLKNFGILNANVSDYRDNKLDYLLNILLDDLASSIGEKDLLFVKNFHSLRTCLLKVDKLIDPLLTIGNDISKFIKENNIVRQSDILVMFEELTLDMLLDWTKNCQEKYKILTVKNESGETVYINGKIFLSKLSEIHQLILYKQDDFSNLSHTEKQEKLSTIEFLTNLGREILASDDKIKNFLGNNENIEKLKAIIVEYSDYQKRILLKTNVVAESSTKKRKKSLIIKISEFFKSIFGGTEEEDNDTISKNTEFSSTRKKTGFSKETKDIYAKIKNKGNKIIPLSDYIELTPENEIKIDNIINELRGNNIKIVIPIYNARNVLYPNRSQKYLISDVDYLMIDTDIILSPESIREFTDSLIGEKLKDEVIPGKAILNIEKYILTLYRQKRALQLKKNK